LLIKFLPKISVIAFVFSLLHEIISRIPLLLSDVQNDLLYPFFFFLSFLLSPIFLFVVMYFVGGNIELKAQLPSVSINLILACWLGSYFGSSIGHYLMGLEFTPLSGPLQYRVMHIAASFVIGVELHFFPSVAAMAIAYLRALKIR